MLDTAAAVRAERRWYLDYYAPENPAEQTPAMVNHWSAWTARLADACEKPAALAAIRAEAKPDAEGGATSSTASTATVRARIYAGVKSAMFRAAISVARDGPGTITRVPAPTDGRPFTLRSWATGFELTSRFALEKKPKAALIVGRR